ncbi:MAG TPA: CotH kinase family protein [Polyangiales bacterium]|nr:CotH kinase family protein [Polyangiales bacterium]
MGGANAAAAGAGGSAAGNSGQTGARDSDAGPALDPSDPGMVIAEPDDDASQVFAANELRSYNLILAAPDLALLDQDPAAEAYVQGMLEVDGEQHGPVGIRYKGSVGAFQPPCTTGGGFSGQPGGAKAGKCSIKVAFDHVDPEGRFHGLKKLNFHAMNADRSMLRERLVYTLFREAGVASPRIVHARVLINGQLEGLFALVEQIDSRFTRARFTEGGKGNLYKEIWPRHDDRQAYLNALESNRNDMPSVDKVLAFKAAIGMGEGAASAWIDRDYLLHYLAADRVTINDDGFLHWWCLTQGQGNNPGGIGNHNYYWYEATTAERFWLIPWDVDMSLGGNPRVRIEPEWREPGACECAGDFFGSMAAVCDPLIDDWAMLGTDYDAAVDSFLAGPFSEANVTAKLDAWSAQITPVVEESSGMKLAPTDAEWMLAAQELRAVVNAARANRGSAY